MGTFNGAAQLAGSATEKGSILYLALVIIFNFIRVEMLRCCREAGTIDRKTSLSVYA